MEDGGRLLHALVVSLSEDARLRVLRIPVVDERGTDGDAALGVALARVGEGSLEAECVDAVHDGGVEEEGGGGSRQGSRGCRGGC